MRSTVSFFPTQQIHTSRKCRLERLSGREARFLHPARLRHFSAARQLIWSGNSLRPGLDSILSTFSNPSRPKASYRENWSNQTIQNSKARYIVPPTRNLACHTEPHQYTYVLRLDCMQITRKIRADYVSSFNPFTTLTIVKPVLAAKSFHSQSTADLWPVYFYANMLFRKHGG